MTEKKIVVAVDGPAGSGKSSVSREVAENLGLKYVDSGAIYRAITLFLLRKHGTLERGREYSADLEGLVIEQRFNPGRGCSTFIHGDDVSSEIRDETIAKNIGIVSDDPKIRDYVNGRLREWSENESIIMDGRDIGTEVFPQAEVKIYLDASAEVRARRRHGEYLESGKTVDLNMIKNQIIQRDIEDASRPVGALRKAVDSIVVDTSHMTRPEVVGKLVEIIGNRERSSFRGPAAERSSDGLQWNGPPFRGSDGMIDHTDKRDDEISMEHVANSAPEEIRPNTVLRGEIVTVDGEFAYVNVGAKSEGRVSLGEFETPPEVGSVIDVMLVNRRMVDGMFVFSKRMAEGRVKWRKFMEWYRAGNTRVTAGIREVGKNGLSVECMGLPAFVPFSQAGDIRFRKSLDASTEYTFKIRKVDERQNNIILSRKEYIEEEGARIWSEFIGKHVPGDRTSGRVLRFTEEGAVVDIDGVEAFLSKENISWKKVFKKRKFLKLGEEREFVILSIDGDNRKAEVGIKQLGEDPWNGAASRYPEGSTVSGRVATVTSFGVFVELQEGIEGLVNTADLSWTKKNVNPRDLYKPGQKVDVQVLSIDEQERKMSLGIRQLLENPWDTMEARHPVGTVMKGKVKKVMNFGVFVEIDGDTDGLVHISDLTWDDDKKDVLDRFKSGDEVEFKILEINRREMKISCGIKQLSKSPWELISEKYPPRSRVSGVVTRITNFGLFVRLEDGVEGLVHISEVSRKKIENLAEHFKPGDPVNAVVLGVEVDKKRLSLSIKHYDMIVEKEELKKILNANNPGKVTLGDILKDKL